VARLEITTPEQWQGRQRPVMVVRHPVDSAFPAAFDLDPGRCCVSLTRHQYACLVVVRGNVAQVLRAYQHDVGARPIGSVDRVWQWVEMHRAFWRALKSQ
jgi:hypothetical protein